MDESISNEELAERLARRDEEREIAKEKKHLSFLMEEAKKVNERIDKAKRDQKVIGYKYKKYKYLKLLDRLNKYDPICLHHWFKFDSWRACEGLFILAGLDPASAHFDEDGCVYRDSFTSKKTPKHIAEFTRLERPHISRLDGIKFGGRLINYDSLRIFPGGLRGRKCTAKEAQVNVLKDYYHLLELWKSGKHKQDRHPPHYFIDWAISKKHPPVWLEWASENGYYAPDGKIRVASGKAESSENNIIAALFDALKKEREKSGTPVNQSGLIAELAESYKGLHGMSESNLNRKIPAVLKLLQMQ